MVPAISPEHGWRLPSCTEHCYAQRVYVPGRVGQAEIPQHDIPGHEAFGRRLGATSGEANDRWVRTGPLEIDLYGAWAALDGRRVSLTPGELRLLLALGRRAGILVPYDELARAVWGYDVLLLDASARRDMLRMAVYRVRRKLGAAGRLISCVIGMGLRLELVPVGAELPLCGRTDRPHNARGYCHACYAAARRDDELERSRHASCTAS